MSSPFLCVEVTTARCTEAEWWRHVGVDPTIRAVRFGCKPIPFQQPQKAGPGAALIARSPDRVIPDVTSGSAANARSPRNRIIDRLLARFAVRIWL
jgi:hypothetical protein